MKVNPEMTVDFYHVAHDIRLVVLGPDRVPRQGHVVSFLDPPQVPGGLLWSWSEEGICVFPPGPTPPPPPPLPR